ncbi:MAG: hypothetical protein Q8R01_15165 [Ramlibacter sp.]|nr:hypothetical protein [Ramlibacter sp.]
MERQCANAEPVLGNGGDELKAAQARWELHLAILHEEERRLVRALEVISSDPSAPPHLAVDRLSAARVQCNEAFQSLMNAIARRASLVATHRT